MICYNLPFHLFIYHCFLYDCKMRLQLVQLLITTNIHRNIVYVSADKSVNKCNILLTTLILKVLYNASAIVSLA